MWQNGSRLWSALALLALVVLAPTAVLIWLVGQAVENERLASRERMRQAQIADLKAAGREIHGRLLSQVRRVDALSSSHSGQRLFGLVLEQRLADAVVCLDAQGRVAYPKVAELGRDLLEGVHAWREAERLEAAGDCFAAAEAYAEIADAGQHPSIEARARLAHARCLEKCGQFERASSVLSALVLSPQSGQATDRYGRLLAVDAGLAALDLAQRQGVSVEQSAPLVARLERLGADYRRTVMPAAQRRMLGRRLAAFSPQKQPPPWLAAEELAARYVETGPALLAETGASEARPWTLSGGEKAWAVVAPRRRAVVLFREATLRRLATSALDELAGTDGQRRLLLAEGQDPPAGAATASLAFPGGWKLDLAAPQQQSDARAERRIALYGWAAMLTVGAILCAAVLMGGIIGRQHRVSRLQNDWLASVSHELKTPLASIRLLTESLQDNDAVDSQEYLRLIGQETARLGRLIDGMLAFSRIENRRIGLDRQSARPEEIAERAAQLIADRLQQPGCRFVSKIDDGLPDIYVDQGALIAVIVNLLDNAWKFTRSDKQIELAVERAGEQVCFRVSDNGVGLAPRDAKRVFRRFFQVDRRLSRSHGGCGLGLALVRLVVQAHGGEVRVDSQVGQGSVFRVLIPAG